MYNGRIQSCIAFRNIFRTCFDLYFYKRSIILF